MKRSFGLLQMLLLAGAVLVSLPAEGIAESGGASTGRYESPQVPLTRIVLYSAGVGYFHHEGHVQGNAEIRFTFPEPEMKDVLKSFVVQDHGGGRVEVIRYESQEPLSRRLSSYSLNLGGTVTPAGLLEQAKGERVDIRGTSRLTGEILGVERRPSDGERPAEVILHLLEGGAVRSIPLSQVDSFSFEDEELGAEMREALDLIAEERRNELKSVNVMFTGEGRRRVSVGFLRPVPVWKTSYRLMAADGDSERSALQAWAVVENTTGDDWTEVELSLVAGTPISFIMDLYTPLRAERPELAPPMAEAVQPAELEEEFDGFADFAAERAEPMRMSSGARAGDAPRRKESKAGGAGVASRSAGTDLGSLFAYEIEGRVSVARNSSALVPILVEEVEAKRVSIYEAGSQRQNPLAAVELHNGTGSHLHPGPYTVFEGGEYAGDSISSHIVPGEERLLGYAVDRDLVVLRERHGEPERAVKMSIRNGTFIYTELMRRKTVYRVQNRSEDEKTLIIEHPKESVWNLVSPGPAGSEGADTGGPSVSETAGAYRLRESVKDRMVLEVREQRPQTRRVGLTDLETGRIEFYLQNFDLSEELREAMQRVRDYQLSIEETNRELANTESTVERIHTEQERIRSNMARLSSDSDLYRTYVRKLRQQESRIERLLNREEELQAKLTKLRNELSTYLQGLDV